jgi:hypothetical protein
MRLLFLLDSEDTSMYFGGDSINGNAEELRAFYKQEYSHLDINSSKGTTLFYI